MNLKMFLSLLAACIALTYPPVGRAQSSNPPTTLFNFSGTYGTGPNGKLLVSKDSNGNTLLYGTTYNGGANNVGTVFELKPSKHGVTPPPTVIHTFGGAGDSSHPTAGLVPDSSGNLYGTAAGTGTDSGIVFQLVPPANGSSTWTYNIIWQFGGTQGDGYPDGNDPNCDLAYLSNSGAQTKLAGTTVAGGRFDEGTAFTLTQMPDGSWQEQVIHDFSGTNGGAAVDGARPYSGLTPDKFGNLYGTTGAGGANYGGTAFELVQSGGSTFPITILFNFGMSPGRFPLAGVYRDQNSGKLFGSTYVGGGAGYGAVYQLTPGTPEYSDATIYAFTDSASAGDGANPSDVPTPDTPNPGTNYGFYLTTGAARTSSGGSVVHLVPPVPPSTSWTSTTLYSFSGGSDGQAPLASVVLDPTGTILYGTTFYGGAFGGGTVFEIKLD